MIELLLVASAWKSVPVSTEPFRVSITRTCPKGYVATGGDALMKGLDLYDEATIWYRSPRKMFAVWDFPANSDKGAKVKFRVHCEDNRDGFWEPGVIVG